MRFSHILTGGLLVLCIAAIHAQEDTTMPLLPSQMGPMESLMWSEHGAMRKIFDFPLTPEGREKEMRLRRNMLGLHQLGGFATLAAMTATVILGQKVYNGDRDLLQLHSAMAWTTVGMYFTTASLGLFTPPPMIRRGEWSTVSTHKLLAAIHFTGMMVTPYLGSQLAKDNRQMQTVHLASAYTTTAAFAAALLVVTF